MSDDFDSSIPFDETAFNKTLPSDIEDSVSLALLNDVYETKEMWHDFQDEEIQQVVEVFSILKMAPGEKLITKGEYATFCGIVLQGTFNAIVSPTLTVPLRAGDLVGEMSLFEGGARNADIVTGTDAEGCILAVITFVDLDNLTMNERYAALARKLTMLFATASINKLRGMLKAAAAAPAALPAAAATTAEAAAAPTAAVPVVVAAGEGDSAAAPPSTVVVPVSDAPKVAEFALVAAPGSPSITAAAAVPMPLSPVATAVNATAAAAAAAAPSATAAAAPAAAGGEKKSVRAKRGEREKKAVVVAETLYKNKMSAASNKDAAAAGGESGAAAAEKKVAPPAAEKARPTNMNDAAQELDDLSYKLKKSEHARRNQQVMLDKASKAAKVSEERLRELEAEVARLTSELKNSQEVCRELGGKLASTQKDLGDATATLEAERFGRRENENRWSMTSKDLNAKMESEVARLTTELAQTVAARDELQRSLEAEQAALAALRASHASLSAQFDEGTATLTAETERLVRDLSQAVARNQALDASLLASQSVVEEQRQALASLSSKVLDLDEKLSAALSWKLKALEFQSGMDAEKKRHVRLSDEWARRERELVQELSAFKTLLKHFAITMYTKEFRVRKLLGGLHKRVSDMLLSTLEEHYATATGREKMNLMAATGGAAAVGGAGTGAGAGAGVASGPPSTSLSSSTFRLVRKRKKAYLDSLLRPGSKTKLSELVTSLDDEVHKLRGPLDAVRERCIHWRATSEAFFQRNIELASKVMQMGRERGGGATQTAGATAATNADNGAEGELMGSPADQARREAALLSPSTSSSSSQSQAAAAEPSAANAGAGTAAARNGGRGMMMSATAASSRNLKEESAGNSAAGNGARAAEGGEQRTAAGAANSKFAQGKQELELLEARCTVLRVHIQQLEQHYLNLQLAIHQGASTSLNAGAGPSMSSHGSESKEQLGSAPGGGGVRADLGDRFDPSLVSPVPFPVVPPAGTMQPGPGAAQMAAWQAQHLAQQQAFHAAQQAHFAQMQHQYAQHPPYPRPGTTGSGSYSARTHRGYQYTPAQPSGPLSPAGMRGPQQPDVLSLRALRDTHGQLHQSQPRLPAVPGAQPNYPLHQQYQQHSQQQQQHSQQQQQQQQHPSVLLATPQRPTLSFSPRPA